MQDRDYCWKLYSLTVTSRPTQVAGEFKVKENESTCVYMLVSREKH